MSDAKAGNVSMGGVTYTDVSWDGIPDESTKVETPAATVSDATDGVVPADDETKEEAGDEEEEGGDASGSAPNNIIPPSIKRGPDLMPHASNAHPGIGSSPKGSIVLFMGMSLLIASAFTSGLLQGTVTIFSDKATKSTAADHKNLIWFVGELIFVMLLTFIADMSGEASNVIIAFFAVLWLVFITNNNIRVTGWLGNLTPGLKQK